MTEKENASVKERLWNAMDEEGMEAYWIVKPENIRYLTGFRGEDCTLLVTKDKFFLLTDRRYSEEAEKITAIDEVVLRDSSMAAAAGGLCKRLELKNLSMVASHVTCADYMKISEKANGTELSLRSSSIVAAFRQCKTSYEIECMKRAMKTAEDGFSRLQEHIEAGRSERWLARRLEWEVSCAGADEVAFNIICAISENSSAPHAQPSERELKSGDSMLVDWGGQVNGYKTDITRLLGLDKVPDKVKKMADIVLDARQAALDVIEPGIEAARVDAAARKVIEDAGYGKFFPHGLGHGVGLEVHEAPHLAPNRKGKLKSGMVMTFEPAIFLPGEFGARVEDMICLTEDGYEILGSELQHTPICI